MPLVKEKLLSGAYTGFRLQEVKRFKAFLNCCEQVPVVNELLNIDLIVVNDFCTYNLHLPIIQPLNHSLFAVMGVHMLLHKGIHPLVNCI